MKSRKPSKKQVLASIGIVAAPVVDVRPLNEREKPLKTRKGMRITTNHVDKNKGVVYGLWRNA